MSLHMRFDCPDSELDRRALRRDVLRVMRCVGRRDAELSVVFVDDAMMRAFSREFRGIDRTTDVLAFPGGDEGEPPLLGDVAISLPTARCQARRHGCSLEAEVRRLIVHGVAHLRGHGHDSPSRARAMRAEERRILAALTGGRAYHSW